MIWLVIALLLLVSFVFSGIEAGILSINRVRLTHRYNLGDPAAIKLMRLLNNPERLLVTVVIVTNLMNISAIVLVTDQLSTWLGARGYFAALCLLLPLQLFGLELLPKSIFRRFPYRALSRLAEPLRVADVLLSPIHALGWRVIRVALGHKPPEQRKLFVAREDFKYLTIESEGAGTLTRAEREMIHNVVDFRAVLVREVMTPMEKVQTIPSDASLSELLARWKATGFDRWPVTGDDGQITGLVDIFDLALDGRRRGTVGSLQRRVVRVDESEPAYAVLRKLRAARASMAVVRGPGGRATGIVSVGDLVNRLVSTARTRPETAPR